ncbi:MAG: hypothetical protein JNL81_00875 [Hyphomonadaceae bacterium]|nr:hypothetical protein [Hyphomonadaceae bacterium]
MTKRAKSPGDTPLLEWLTGGVGAIVFCAMLGVLVAAGADGAGGPPNIQVSVERIAPTRAGYVVEFEAENSGDQTAAAVDILAELASGETARAHIDYLPPHSVRRGGVFFERDPRAGAVSLRAEGYADP